MTTRNTKAAKKVIVVRWINDHALDRSGLHRARRRLEDLEHGADAAIAEARQKGLSGDRPGDALYELRYKWHLETEYAEEVYRGILTEQLVKKARKRMLPIPPRTEDDDMWEEGQFAFQWYLTDRGITALRTALREDSKARWEPWILLGTLLVGLLGAATGFVAVLRAS